MVEQEIRPAPVENVPEPASSKKGRKERGHKAMDQEAGMRRQTVYEET